MSRPSVAVVGATSNVARILIPRLLQAGHSVTPLTRDPTSLPADQQAVARRYDLNDPVGLKRNLADASHIVSCVPWHMSASVISALPRQTARFILLGSTRLFTRFPDQQVALLRQAVADQTRLGLPSVVLHPTMIYGGTSTGNIHRIAAYIDKFGAVPLPDGGKALIQPVHADDVADCIVAALNLDSAIGPPLVIAGPQPITYRDFVLAIGEAIGKRPRIIPLPQSLICGAALLTGLIPKIPTVTLAEARRLGEDKCFDISDMQQRLSVTPMPLVQGLRRAFSV